MKKQFNQYKKYFNNDLIMYLVIIIVIVVFIFLSVSNVVGLLK
ncbi:hypothetical protein MNBD_BACTEROID06-1846 [hydrothermal vent metagenome]|uniref:Uncharacterized protein n=1 Tax=hydrothermal vent metagenome TaxID=652676 RepID=A0A3B0U4Z1_9ZZZZ